MKVVHVVYSDIRGGASKAALALNKALQNIGVDSKMLVQRKYTNEKSVYTPDYNFWEKQKTNVRILLDLAQMKIFTKMKKGRFSFGDIGLNINENNIIQEADLIHLHWINGGLLSFKSLSALSRLKKPIVWTLHDMWAFTGGCHYSAGCNRYLSSCGHCPYLHFSYKSDYSNKFWKTKKNLYDKSNITYVTCSKWLATVAKDTPILKTYDVIPIHNTLDINIYKPLDKRQIREKLNLPQDKFLIIFVALSIEEERKGFQYLKKSLVRLLEKYPLVSQQIELLILGRSSNEQLEGIPFKINSVGRKMDDINIAEYYNTANVFLAPSLEDNLPNTVLESLSCGTPVIAFNVGGIPEMVEHKKNGYLSKERSVEDFSEGIYWIFQNNNIDEIEKYARSKVVEHFNPQLIANNHLSVYQKLVKK